MNRLEYDADTTEEVVNYFQTRARQLITDGFVWQKDITAAPGGLITTFEKDGESFKSYYAYSSFRGKGFASRVIGSIKERIVTSPDCHIEDFLIAKKKDYVLAGLFTETIEYKAIQEFYNNEKANRSQCYLMNHIDEALFIMTSLNASDVAKRAFCIHPLVQNDKDLADNWESLKNKFEPEVLGLAMEYRNIANAYLSHRKIKHIDEIALSPIHDVNQMLIGDKIQNYKDFLIYHYGTHERSDVLNKYFKNWLKVLQVSESSFKNICTQLKSIEFHEVDFKISPDDVVTHIAPKKDLELLSKFLKINIKQVAAVSNHKNLYKFIDCDHFNVGFRKYNENTAYLKYLDQADHIVSSVVSKSMNIDSKKFDDFMESNLCKHLKAITKNDTFEKKYAIFQLKENYKDFSDIEYYEVCYSTNWTASGHAYYLFRFYLDEIKSSCVLEEGTSKFPYHQDKQEAKRPKIVISTCYKDFSSLNLLFLENYKREISKTLGIEVEEVNEDTIKLINMIAF